MKLRIQALALLLATCFTSIAQQSQSSVLEEAMSFQTKKADCNCNELNIERNIFGNPIVLSKHREFLAWLSLAGTFVGEIEDYAKHYKNSKPFTGNCSEQYSNDKRKKYLSYTNGKLDGVMAFYFSNGEVSYYHSKDNQQTLRGYKNGQVESVKIGESYQVSYYENGQKKEEKTLELHQKWHENGQISYKEDLKTGKKSAWNEEGVVTLSGDFIRNFFEGTKTYEKNLKTGKETWWSIDGIKTKEILNSEYNSQISFEKKPSVNTYKKKWWSNGNLYSIHSYDLASNTFIENYFNEDGSVRDVTRLFKDITITYDSEFRKLKFIDENGNQTSLEIGTNPSRAGSFMQLNNIIDNIGEENLKIGFDLVNEYKEGPFYVKCSYDKIYCNETELVQAYKSQKTLCDLLNSNILHRDKIILTDFDCENIEKPDIQWNTEFENQSLKIETSKRNYKIKDEHNNKVVNHHIVVVRYTNLTNDNITYLIRKNSIDLINIEKSYEWKEDKNGRREQVVIPARTDSLGVYKEWEITLKPSETIVGDVKSFNDVNRKVEEYLLIPNEVNRSKNTERVINLNLRAYTKEEKKEKDKLYVKLAKECDSLISNNKFTEARQKLVKMSEVYPDDYEYLGIIESKSNRISNNESHMEKNRINSLKSSIKSNHYHTAKNVEEIKSKYVTVKTVQGQEIQLIKKKKLYNAYDISMKYLNDKYRALKDDELQERSDVISRMFKITELMIKLFDENTKEIEKKLKGVDDPEEVLLILESSI